MTPGRRVSEQLTRNCGTFVPVNRKYQQRSAAQQQGSKVCETIINAGGNLGEFHAHLYVTIGWGKLGDAAAIDKFWANLEIRFARSGFG
jgi:hypothetical protein